MKLTALQLFIWTLSIVSALSLAVIMATRRNYRRWPFLFATALCEVASCICIITLTENYAAYFYTFWGFQIVRALLGFGIIFDIVKAIPGVTLAPRNLVILFVAAAAAMSAGSVWLASSGGPHTFHITVLALSLDRCIAVAWGSFAISLFYAIGFCGAGWTRTPLRLAITFLLLTLLSIGNSYAMSTWVEFASKIYDFFNFCTIGIWISWSGIMRFEKEKEPIAQSDGALTFARALMLTTSKTAN